MWWLRLSKTIQSFFKWIRYHIAYFWGRECGLIAEPRGEYLGLALQDALPVSLSEGVEYALSISKHYGWSFTYCYEKLRYGDLSVLYAKLSNDKAFENYNNYIALDDEARAKFVKDWGEPKPYEFDVNTPERQKERLQKHERDNPLQAMYKKGR